jgi:general secretion pathway protein J
VITSHVSVSGFTLLELLVAMAVFAVMSALAYGGLTSVLNARVQTDQSAARLQEIQTAFLWLQRDIEQAVARGIRDEFGAPTPALQGGLGAPLPLALTRGDEAQPIDTLRATLRRVAYRIEGDVLQRLSWLVLDRVQTSAPRTTPLLSGVLSLRLRFLGKEWGSAWPPTTETIATLPRAIEVTLRLREAGDLRRLLLVASG